MKGVICNNRYDSQIEKKEDEPDRIQRRPIPFDDYYDYDDPDVQRRVKLAPGVFKEYLNETTYELVGRNVNRNNDYQDEYNANENDYSDEEDYYRDNFPK